MLSFRHLVCETSDVLELVFGVKLAQYFWVEPCISQHFSEVDTLTFGIESRRIWWG